MQPRIVIVAISAVFIVLQSGGADTFSQDEDGDRPKLWTGRPAWVDRAAARDRFDRENAGATYAVHNGFVRSDMAAETVVRAIYQREPEVTPALEMKKMLLELFPKHKLAIEKLYQQRIEEREDDDLIPALDVDNPLREVAIDELRKRERIRSEDFSDQLALLLSQSERKIILKSILKRGLSPSMGFALLADELMFDEQQRKHLVESRNKLAEDLDESARKQPGRKQPRSAGHATLVDMLSVLKPEQLSGLFLLRGDIDKTVELEKLPELVNPVFKKLIVDVINKRNRDGRHER